MSCVQRSFRRYENEFVGKTTYFDGRRITGLDWDYIESVFGVAGGLN